MSSDSNFQVRVANLTVRVHFKKQLQVRSDAVSITTKEKEKERDKSIKIVARLEKKLAREEESLAKLVLEAAASNQAVQDLVAEEDGQSWKSKYAKAELVRMEVEAQAKVDNSLVKTMGNKVETMDEDLNAALEMLRKDHMCCRGHDISTKEDKKAYDELKDKLLGHNVTWGGTEDDQGASGSLGTPGGSTREPPYFKYTEAARLNLPSLRAEHSEQAAYEAPDDVGQDTEVTESSRVQSISPEVIPGTPQPLRQVRGTPKLMVEGTPQLSRPSPKLPQVKVCILFTLNNMLYRSFYTCHKFCKFVTLCSIRCRIQPSSTLLPLSRCPTRSRSPTPPPLPSLCPPPSFHQPCTCPSPLHLLRQQPPQRCLRLVLLLQEHCRPLPTLPVQKRAWLPLQYLLPSLSRRPHVKPRLSVSPLPCRQAWSLPPRGGALGDRR